MGAYPHPFGVNFSPPSTVGLCVVGACPVDPVVIACPVIESVVDSVVWFTVLIILHSFNVMVVFTCGKNNPGYEMLRLWGCGVWVHGGLKLHFVRPIE